jgi:hypothetical protein
MILKRPCAHEAAERDEDKSTMFGGEEVREGRRFPAVVAKQGVEAGEFHGLEQIA